jgi:hypothetical protein
MEKLSLLFLLSTLLLACCHADVHPVRRNSILNKKTEDKETHRKLLALRGGSSGDLNWRYFVAGGICAACSHGIATPIGINFNHAAYCISMI